MVIISPAESRFIKSDPDKRCRIVNTRVCYRSKQAGKDPEVMAQLGEPAVKPKARLVVQGFKDPGRS